MAERHDDDRLESLRTAAEEDILSASDEAVLEEGGATRVRALFANALRTYGYASTGLSLPPTRRRSRDLRAGSSYARTETGELQAAPLRAVFGPPQDPEEEDFDSTLRPRPR